VWCFLVGTNIPLYTNTNAGTVIVAEFQRMWKCFVLFIQCQVLHGLPVSVNIKTSQGWVWWLTPVISVIWETEIGRHRLGKKLVRPNFNKQARCGACCSSYLGGIGRLAVGDQLRGGKCKTLSEK
jgi:hypothetical protein